MSREEFPAMWIGPGLPGIRDCDGTYCETPLQSVPRVKVNDDLSWLTPLHPSIDAEMQRFRPDEHHRERYARNAAAILADAAERQLPLSAAFRELIQSEALQDRVPSVTACYFELPEKIAAAPFETRDHIVRFMNDQQCCVVWYLHLPEHGEPHILGFYPFGGITFLEEVNPGDVANVAEAANGIRIVAYTFAEFLYRHWIENTIWFKRWRGLDLAPAEAAYVESYSAMRNAD